MRHPLWSDGADKARILQIPDGSVIDTSTTPWTWPEGTRIWKEFSDSAGNPLETRVIELLPSGRWADRKSTRLNSSHRT